MKLSNGKMGPRVPRKIALDVFSTLDKAATAYRSISGDVFGWGALHSSFSSDEVVRVLLKKSDLGVSFTFIPFSTLRTAVEIVHFYESSNYIKNFDAALDLYNHLIQQDQPALRHLWSNMVWSKEGTNV